MSTATIGAAKISRIEESYGLFFEAKTFFTDWRDEIVAEHMPWMVPDHFDPASGYLKLSIHSWLIEIGGRTILIDTCVGNHKPRAARPFWDQLNTPYLDRLAAAGVRPERIDMVMCTHLHVDHVGWNTRLDNGRWVPTFPNAKYVFSKTDYDHFLAIDRDPERGPASMGAFRDSVLPVVEAGLAHMVEGAQSIEEHISLEPAPGHTPGHVLINLASQGSQAFFSGDIIHHGIQVYHPTWSSFACLDPVAAVKSRRMLLEKCAGSGALLAPQHFGAPHLCHIDAKGDGFTPRFV
jgi:glyoxylase-like metal-dependent hydrolase (beta-lactamase superfamily II)